MTKTQLAKEFYGYAAVIIVAVAHLVCDRPAEWFWLVILAVMTLIAAGWHYLALQGGELVKEWQATAEAWRDLYREQVNDGDDEEGDE